MMACDASISHGQLKRHLMRNHKNEELVASALANPTEDKHILEKIRVQRIHKYNQSRLSLTGEVDLNYLMRERKPGSEDSVIRLD